MQYIYHRLRIREIIPLVVSIHLSVCPFGFIGATLCTAMRCCLSLVGLVRPTLWSAVGLSAWTNQCFPENVCLPVFPWKNWNIHTLPNLSPLYLWGQVDSVFEEISFAIFLTWIDLFGPQPRFQPWINPGRGPKAWVINLIRVHSETGKRLCSFGPLYQTSIRPSTQRGSSFVLSSILIAWGIREVYSLAVLYYDCILWESRRQITKYRIKSRNPKVKGVPALCEKIANMVCLN